jgi:hypothetical protein
METKITKLDKLTVQHIRKRLATALEPLAKELAVAIDIGNCTFRENNCQFKLNVALLNSEGKAITEEADCFKNNAKLFGFEPDDLGRKFVFRGQSYAICGLKPKSSKYPVIAQSDNGKSYKFPCRTVLSALGR